MVRPPTLTGHSLISRRSCQKRQSRPIDLSQFGRRTVIRHPSLTTCKTEEHIYFSFRNTTPEFIHPHTNAQMQLNIAAMSLQGFGGFFSIDADIIFAAQMAFLVVPMLALIVRGISHFVDTYGNAMATLIKLLSRVFVELAQLVVIGAALLMLYDNIRTRDLCPYHSDCDFRNATANAIHYAASSIGFVVFGFIAVYALEVIAGGKMPTSWFELWTLEPLSALSLLLRGSKRTTGAERSTASASASDATATKSQEQPEKSDAVAEIVESADDTTLVESPLEVDSELSTHGLTEVAGWQSVSKAVKGYSRESGGRCGGRRICLMEMFTCSELGASTTS